MEIVIGAFGGYIAKRYISATLHKPVMLSLSKHLCLLAYGSHDESERLIRE